MSSKDSPIVRASRGRNTSKVEAANAIADRIQHNADLSLESEAREHFPSDQEIWTGVSLFAGNVVEDAKQFLRILNAEDLPSAAAYRDALDIFLLQPNRFTARSLANKSGGNPALGNRALFYASAFGDSKAASDVNICHWPACDESLMVVMIEGHSSAFESGKADQPGSGWQSIALHAGISHIDIVSEHAAKVQHALQLVEERREQDSIDKILEHQAAAVDPDDVGFDDPSAEGYGSQVGPADEYRESAEFHENLRAGMIERLAEIAARNRGQTKLILQKIEKTYGADRKDFMRTFEPIAGNELPLIEAEFPHEIMHDLIDAWPHAVDVITEIFRDIKPEQPLRLPTVLLVGAPGSGKTTLLTEIVRCFSMPNIVYPCATIADSSFGGTPAQWSTRRGSTPLDLIRQSKIANPAVILDELEKSGSSNHNGSLVYSLLPMLEAHTAQAYYEVGLEMTSDLSAVSFLATANSLDLPAPLRDRFRILQMPDAGPEHVQVLSRRMIRQIEIGRGLDPGWIEPLDGDEIEVIQKCWGGGSLRKLKSAIEVTVTVREKQHRSMN